MNELIPLESTFSAGRRWQPPLSPDHYDCSPLTAVEWKAVQCCAATDKSQTITPRYREALSQLGRIDQPFEDAYLLGHSAAEKALLRALPLSEGRWLKQSVRRESFSGTGHKRNGLLC